MGFCGSGFCAAEVQALEGRVRLGTTENGFGTAGAAATVLPDQVTSRSRLSPSLPRDPLQEFPGVRGEDYLSLAVLILLLDLDSPCWYAARSPLCSTHSVPGTKYCLRRTAHEVDIVSSCE